MASSKAPTPGRTTFSAAATTAGSLVIDGRMADLLEALLHAAKVAHAVVDDGDHGDWDWGLGTGDWGLGTGDWG